MENTVTRQQNDWNEYTEKLLKSWAESANCLKIMHYKAYIQTWYRNAMFKIPILILSTLVGTMNLSMGDLDKSYQIYIMYILGFINITNSILLSIATVMEYTQHLEAHRIAYVEWGKFSRKIQIELSKKRSHRNDCNEFMASITKEYDHIYDIAPMLKPEIISWFKNKVINKEKESIYRKVIMTLFFLTELDRTNISANIELPDIIGDLKPIDIDMLSDSINSTIFTNSKNNTNRTDSKNKTNYARKNQDDVNDITNIENILQ